MGRPSRAGRAAEIRAEPSHRARLRPSRRRIGELLEAEVDAPRCRDRQPAQGAGPDGPAAGSSRPRTSRSTRSGNRRRRDRRNPPPDALASIRQSDLYAPPPELTGGRSLFYEAELGSFRSKQAAEAGWRRHGRRRPAYGLTPRYTAVGADTRLTAGPLASQAAVDALCVELSALPGRLPAVARR